MTVWETIRLRFYARICNTATRIAGRSLLVSNWALQKQARIIRMASATIGERR